MDERKKKPDSLLDEQAADLGKTGAAAIAPAAGAAIAAVETGRKLAAAATPEGSMADYLIAGGGARSQTGEAAISGAVVSALNRIAGFKSRM